MNVEMAKAVKKPSPVRKPLSQRDRKAICEVLDGILEIGESVARVAKLSESARNFILTELRELAIKAEGEADPELRKLNKERDRIAAKTDAK